MVAARPAALEGAVTHDGDQYLRRRTPLSEIEPMLFDRRHTNWAGPVAMIVGMGVSIWLFSNQTEYHGVVPTHVPAVGDITFEVGFVITAVIYLTWQGPADYRIYVQSKTFSVRDAAALIVGARGGVKRVRAASL